MSRPVAKLCMSLVRIYYRDLCEYFAGDVGRWSRMVIDGGKSIPTASVQGWASHIDHLAPECVEYHADELRRIFAQLGAWGLTVNHSIFDESGEGTP